MTITTSSIVSGDGTRIAYDRRGTGPAVILVVGAFNTRSTGAPLAGALAPRFTVYTYDRRGRGDSGDTQPYAVEREIDDLAALLREAGGSAAVFGYSSGAALALLAAARESEITRLALYDLPIFVPPQPGPGHAAALAELVRSGRRGDAVEYFQGRVVGLPAALVEQLRGAPFRPALEAMAHTLVYEMLVTRDNQLALDFARELRTPTLAIAAGAGAPFMRHTAEALARMLPAGRAHVVDGATHDLDAARLAPLLCEHYA